MANQFLTLLQQINKKMEEVNYRKEVMNMAELAKYTGWSKSYLYQLTSNRIIPHYQPQGKTLFFRRSEIDKWIFQHRIATAEELHVQKEQETVTKSKKNAK